MKVRMMLDFETYDEFDTQQDRDDYLAGLTAETVGLYDENNGLKLGNIVDLKFKKEIRDE